nr:putative transposase En/Spm [Ipomoea batatas]
MPNAKQKNKRLMSQPPIESNSETNQPSLANDVQNSSQPSNTFPQSSRNSDSDRTISASPNNVPSPPTSPSSRPTVLPIGNKSFEPWGANRDVIECVTRIFPDAVKSYNDAPRHMKDVWFNEFRKLYKWNPEDEANIQNLFHKKAARRLSDTLSQVRKKLAKGDAQPNWMTDQVLAQYRSIWNTEKFKKTVEKNKRNRNSDCGGLGPSLHTGGSIPITEHRRRLKEKLGEEPSHAVLFQATHKSKKTKEFICKKAQQVMCVLQNVRENVRETVWQFVMQAEVATQKQQTQPELGDSNAWYEAAGGLKKGGYVFGFGSDTPHYFPDVVRQKNLKSGQSSSHVVCDEKIDKLNGEIEWLKSEIMAIRAANQQSSQCTNPTGSHESSGVGLDDLEINDGTESPMQE